MALFIFTKAINDNQAIDVYNIGNHSRDFSYIDDIVEGVIQTTLHNATADQTWDPKAPKLSTSKVPCRIYNIGAQTPVHLLTFIETLEKALGKTAQKNLVPMQPGDVPDTYADVESLVEAIYYWPSTPLDKGIGAFFDWYKNYYQ